ncbi:hypothetical protein VNO77_25645 [Canavalia gladiata]|uniref:Ribosomal protein L38 n=1 Tax=Canavalia gladiata TaxID=3824 RepID=A0AAN9L9U9_CANGL
MENKSPCPSINVKVALTCRILGFGYAPFNLPSYCFCFFNHKVKAVHLSISILLNHTFFVPSLVQIVLMHVVGLPYLLELYSGVWNGDKVWASRPNIVTRETDSRVRVYEVLLTCVLQFTSQFLLFPLTVTAGPLVTMPKQIQEIKDFLLTARRKDARSVKIKRSRDVVKFKVRCSKYLYTLCVFDPEKADKLKQSLPPGLSVQDL